MRHCSHLPLAFSCLNTKATLQLCIFATRSSHSHETLRTPSINVPYMLIFSNVYDDPHGIFLSEGRGSSCSLNIQPRFLFGRIAEAHCDRTSDSFFPSHEAKHPHVSFSDDPFPILQHLAPVRRTMCSLVPFSPVSWEKAYLREMVALRFSRSGCS
ncbi:hypothetical protein EDB86DRAFT_1914097 [Lactarius hatsudake]|nr:hypothetical protein EDB86DRAFT_1914097 [Lactarius hatsudake]